MKCTTRLVALGLDFEIREPDKPDELSVDIVFNMPFCKVPEVHAKKLLFFLVVKIFDDATLLKRQRGFERIKVHSIKVVDNGQECLLNDALVITSRQREPKCGVMCPARLHKPFREKFKAFTLT